MSNRKMFPDSVTPLPDAGTATPQGLVVQSLQEPVRTESMTLLFALRPSQSAQAELEARVAKGEIIPEDELKQKYSPTDTDLAKLATWLKSEGYSLVGKAADNLGVYARATVNQIEQSLNVNMVQVTRDGVTYSAAQDVPSLPSDVGDPVNAIVGLQPFRHANKHARQVLIKQPLHRRNGVAAEIVANGAAGGTAVAVAPAVAAATGVPPYFVSDILDAYEANGLGVTGAGQTIAILIDTVPNITDLTAFWTANDVNVTPAQIQTVNVNNVQLPAPEGEETLDVSWTSGIATDATIRIYATGTLQFVDLDAALDAIIADSATIPGMRQLSISLGLGETYMGGPNGEVATQHDKYVRLAARGVNVFVSTGDAGSNPDDTGHSSSGPLQAEFSSTDPMVIAVGGTSLRMAGGSASSETGWAGSGGGKSVLFPRPAWQIGTGVAHGGHRLVPDVCAVADPNTGAYLVINGSETQIGGTSWSAPIWAAFCALINEGRAKAGKTPLPYLNPMLYPMIGTSSFRDIVSGSNGAYKAGHGHDLVTGIGAPRIGNLLKALVAKP